ncbi:YbdD/YjiX family protein [Methylomonas sp. LL1]|uniref:CstA-like transporter-associated (seleno)protein n=1 Tax=Methylomonas sp. LL1 TaxID=2785785 RepID=UPI0018C3ABF8|nr:YbdD/YjiX family protein [Methylomonas sp. LL1]QPK63317.1 YbdD/YjiX family protein [Methylomonas sp. LL1]
MYESIKAGFARLQALWRNLNGDTDYQRYLEHWHSHHVSEQVQPLNRKAFFAAETQRKWNGVKRCC